jgi:hypothetical protein
MMKVSRAHCAMVPHNRGCGKGAYTKGNFKQDTIKSFIGSATQDLLKSCAPAPGSDFAVSQKTHEHFTVAVCIILMWYSLKEATISVNAEKPRAQVRAGPVQQHCVQDLAVRWHTACTWKHICEYLHTT